MRPMKRKTLVRLPNGRHRPETSLERFYRERAEANRDKAMDAERRARLADHEASTRRQQIFRLLANDPTGALPDDIRERVVTELVERVRQAFGDKLAEHAGHLFKGRFKPVTGRARSHVRNPQPPADPYTETLLRVTVPELVIECGQRQPWIR